MAAPAKKLNDVSAGIDHAEFIDHAGKPKILLLSMSIILAVDGISVEAAGRANLSFLDLSMTQFVTRLRF